MDADPLCASRRKSHHGGSARKEKGTGKQKGTIPIGLLLGIRKSKFTSAELRKGEQPSSESPKIKKKRGEKHHSLSSRPALVYPCANSIWRAKEFGLPPAKTTERGKKPNTKGNNKDGGKKMTRCLRPKSGGCLTAGPSQKKETRIAQQLRGKKIQRRPTTKEAGEAEAR